MMGFDDLIERARKLQPLAPKLKIFLAKLCANNLQGEVDISMLDSFFSSFMLFEILFAIVFILAVFTIIYRIIKSRNPEQERMPTVIKEREIIKEIVKIRCPYCNNLYDEIEDKCPNCGGRKSP